MLEVPTGGRAQYQMRTQWLRQAFVILGICRTKTFERPHSLFISCFISTSSNRGGQRVPSDDRGAVSGSHTGAFDKRVACFTVHGKVPYIASGRGHKSASRSSLGA